MQPYADVFGFAAAAATLLTFWQTQALPMRLFAVASNILSILYGWLSGNMPPLVLHLVLLPLNTRMLIVLNTRPDKN